MVLGGLPVLDPSLLERQYPQYAAAHLSANGKGQLKRPRIEQSGFTIKFNHVVWTPCIRHLSRSWSLSSKVVSKKEVIVNKSFVVVWLAKTRSTKISFGSRRWSHRYYHLVIFVRVPPDIAQDQRPQTTYYTFLWAFKKAFPSSWYEKPRDRLHLAIFFFFETTVSKLITSIMNPGHDQQIGAYVNSLTPATNLSLASGRNSHQNPSSSQLPSAEEASCDEIFERPNLIIAVFFVNRRCGGSWMN